MVFSRVRLPLKALPDTRQAFLFFAVGFSHWYKVIPFFFFVYAQLITCRETLFFCLSSNAITGEVKCCVSVWFQLIAISHSICLSLPLFPLDPDDDRDLQLLERAESCLQDQQKIYVAFVK